MSHLKNNTADESRVTMARHCPIRCLATAGLGTWRMAHGGRRSRPQSWRPLLSISRPEFVHAARRAALHRTCNPTAVRGRLHTQSLCCECRAGSTREMRSQVSDHRLRSLHSRSQSHKCGGLRYKRNASASVRPQGKAGSVRKNFVAKAEPAANETPQQCLINFCHDANKNARTRDALAANGTPSGHTNHI